MKQLKTHPSGRVDVVARSQPISNEISQLTNPTLDIAWGPSPSIFRAEPNGRHSSASSIKREGIHYTPPELAQFLASQAIQMMKKSGPLRVLDPSCGDGALLAAVAEVAVGRDLILCGLDQDASAISAARVRLMPFENESVKIELHEANFLDEVLRGREFPMSVTFDDAASLFSWPYDLVIANPPYVRTQVLGATLAKQLATHFGLSGRVDLYHAFAVAIAEVLESGGTMGLLCSNRFMTTRTGRDLRQLLATKFQIHHVFDLGDTKQFSAAVLPALVIATNRPQVDQTFDLTSIYESKSSATPAIVVENIFSRLASRSSENVESNGRRFTVRSTKIAPRTWDQPWVAISEAECELQQRISSRAALRFKDVGKIRVGIKTTCDKVFIRRDWSDLPEEIRPEDRLLLPLLTHHAAGRWHANAPQVSVLYPYDLGSDRRIAVDLDDFPRTKRYLESHRAILEARKYVAEGGRHWWEIWVPHRPSAWQRKKIVFPDISDEPKFSMDNSGAVVNGDCYWMLVDEKDSDSLSLLMLAVANSTLGSEFYDKSCGNKLYAGRRRYITQYVSEFPIPDPSTKESLDIIKTARELFASNSEDRRLELENEIDHLVWRAFGVEER